MRFRAGLRNDTFRKSGRAGPPPRMSAAHALASEKTEAEKLSVHVEFRFRNSARDRLGRKLEEAGGMTADAAIPPPNGSRVT